MKSKIARIFRAQIQNYSCLPKNIGCVQCYLRNIVLDLEAKEEVGFEKFAARKVLVVAMLNVESGRQ